jgi:hypothetical protein
MFDDEEWLWKNAMLIVADKDPLIAATVDRQNIGIMAQDSQVRE